MRGGVGGAELLAPFYPIQYGVNITTTAVYLNQYQFILYKQMQELFVEFFSQSISQETLVNSMVNRAHEEFKSAESYIKNQPINASVAHFDETGLYVQKHCWWLHLTSNDSYTYYYPHPKRGQVAIDAIGILPVFKGTSTHDCWDAYFMYEDCTHAICNVHNLCEGRTMIELHDQNGVKGKQKVSCTFCTEEEASHFSRIRGIISTIKKTG